MKRFTVIALALVMSFSMLTACSSTEEVDTVGTVGAEPPDTDGDTDGDSGDIDEVPPEYREENKDQAEN